MYQSSVLLFAFIVILLLYILPVILFFKLWKMTNNVQLMKNKICNLDKTHQAKVAFMEGDTTNAQRLLDRAFYEEVITLAAQGKNNTIYQRNYPLVVSRFRKLYYRLELTAPDFEIYEDIRNIP